MTQRWQPPLPVALPPCEGELLSSWIARHAAFYVVSPRIMLRHCLEDRTSLRAVNLRLSDYQAARLAHMFSIPATRIQRMSFANVHQSLHHYIATKPVHVRMCCHLLGAAPTPVLRSQLASWRIICDNCGDRLQYEDVHRYASLIERYQTIALQGEKLLDDEIERGVMSWTSPTRIAQLLLLRRFTRAVCHEGMLWRFRILGEVIAEFDDICGPGQQLLPSASNPILPLHIRLLWLAGVAIVERAGPAMLDALRWLMLNSNGIDFGETATLVPVTRGVTNFTGQMQLIRESLV